VELAPPLRTRLARFDWAVLAVLVLSRLALLAVDAPHRAEIGRGELPYYEGIYPGLAEQLVTTGRYVYPPQEPDSDLRRPPGYPLVLAATYLVVGTGPSVAVLLWNVVGVVVLYLGLLRLLAAAGLRGRRAAAAVFAADLAWLLYTKEVTTEPVYTPFLVWGVVGLLNAARATGVRPAVQAAAVSGALLGTSALLKPVSLYLPVVVVPFLLAARRDVWPALALAAAFALCVGPWYVRNLVVHDALSYTSIQNDNLLFAHGAFVWADLHGLTHLDAQTQLDAELTRRLAGRPATYAVQNAAKAQLAREVLGRHPLLYARAVVRGVAITLFDPGRLVFNRTFPTEDTRGIGLLNIVARDGVWGAFRALLAKSPLMVISLVLYIAFLAAVAAGAAAGVVPLLRAQPTAFWLLFLVTAYLLAIGGPNGYARFRLYVFPFELVFLQAGVEALGRWRAARREVGTVRFAST
jgi:hypothetical protein